MGPSVTAPETLKATHQLCQVQQGHCSKSNCCIADFGESLVRVAESHYFVALCDIVVTILVTLVLYFDSSFVLDYSVKL